MKKLHYFMIIATIALIITSCARPYPNEILKVHMDRTYKGITSDSVRKDIAPPNTVLNDFEFVDNSGRKVYVEVYRSGYYYNMPKDNPFIYAYVDKKLIYFGYPYEFAFHHDPLINEIGKKAMEKFNNTKGNK